MNESILIVDDDADIRNMIGIYLENEGFHVLKCADASSALTLLEDHQIDLILLDIMMEGMDGYQACIQIRDMSKVPIIFMSAKSQDMDKIQGLSIGADDYIVKPFHPLELVSRVKAQIRRHKHYDGQEALSYSYKDLNVLPMTRQAFLKGKALNLTPKEFDILSYLLMNKGLTLTIAQIYENVWHDAYMENDNTVLMHISHLIEKLAQETDEDYIKTVWGVGYKI